MSSSGWQERRKKSQGTLLSLLYGKGLPKEVNEPDRDQLRAALTDEPGARLAVVWLATRCDGGRATDGKGFNKDDAIPGELMAIKVVQGEAWSEEEQAQAAVIRHRYRRNQLLPAGYAPAVCEAPPHEWVPFRPIRHRSGGEARLFPLAVLPAPYVAYVQAVAKEVGVGTCFCATALLCTAAGINQRRFDVEVRSGWRERLWLGALIGLPSGASKSPVVKKLRGLLRAGLEDLLEDWGDQLQIVKNRRKQAERRLAKATKAFDDFDEEDDEGPSLEEVEQRLLAAQKRLGSIPDVRTVKPWVANLDASPEGLAQALWEREESLLVLDEDGILVTMMLGRWGKDPRNEIIFASMGGSGGLEVYRSQGKRMTLKDPVLSAVACTQPSLLRQLVERDRDEQRGVMPRFMVELGTANCGDVAAPGVPWLQEAGMGALISNLMSEAYPEPPREGELWPAPRQTLRLSPAARKRLVEDFRREEWAKLEHGQDNEVVKSFVRKSAGLAARIAGNLHLIHCRPSSEPISLATIEAGIALARRATSIQRSLAVGAADRMADVDRQQALVAFLVENAENGELMWSAARRLLGAHRGAERRAEIRHDLDSLERAGYLYVRKGEPSAKGGRPAEMIVLRPGLQELLRDGHEHSPDTAHTTEVPPVPLLGA